MELILAISIIVGCLFGYFYNRNQKKYAYKIALKIEEQTKDFLTYYIQQKKSELTKEISHLQRNFRAFLQKVKKSNYNWEKQLEQQKNRSIKFQHKLEELERFVKNKEKITKEFSNSVEKTTQELVRTKLFCREALFSLLSADEEEIKKKILIELSADLEKEKENLLNSRIEFITANSKKLVYRILSSIFRYKKSHAISSLSSSTQFSPIKQGFVEKITPIFKEQLEVDLLFINEDTVSIAGVDGYKREVARETLEEVVEKQQCVETEEILVLIDKNKKLLEQDIIQTAKDICKETKIDNLSLDFLKLLGRLKYRVSFGQNILWHSVESAYIASLLAGEVGLNINAAKRAGLFHDIGKAVDHEKEGGHPEIGQEIIESSGESAEVMEGVIGHHDDVQVHTPYATLISISDAVSASRPGARRDSIERYTNRLERLEKIALSVEGVINAYAISAGREVRVVVNPGQVSDKGTAVVAKNIVKRIKRELPLFGSVKITVMREIKIVEMAQCRR